MAKHDDPKAQNLPKSATRITVACKYPHGVILQLYKQEMVEVAAPGGPRKELKSFQVGEAVKINGPVAPTNQSSPHETSGGFALTHGVDAEFFREWMKQNEHSDLVKNGLIFSASDRASARDRAEEHKKTRTGIEPLDMPKPGKPVTDVRVTRTVGAQVGTADVGKTAA